MEGQCHPCLQEPLVLHEISFGDGTAVIDDEYGMAHHLAVAPGTSSLGILHQEFAERLDGDPTLPFWDYGLVLPDILRVDMEGQANYMRSNWQYLDAMRQWNEFE
jgi:hypothetical protein